MALDINGYNISESAGLTLGGIVSLRSTGTTDVPNTPAFSGVKLNSAAATSGFPWSVESINTNIGSPWTSSNTFTCPMAGAYYVSMSMIIQGTGSQTTSVATYGGVVKNGALYGFYHTNSTDGWDSVTHQMIVTCAVGDTIQYTINAAPSQVGAGAGAYGSNHNAFTIWYMG